MSGPARSLRARARVVLAAWALLVCACDAPPLVVADAVRDNGPADGAPVDVRPPPDGRVVDAIPSDASTDAAEPIDAAQAQARLYGAEIVVRVDIELDEAAYQALRDSPREWVSGNVVIDGQRRDDVGIRLKGSASFKPIHSKAAFKIDIDRFQPDARLHGMGQFTLNNMVQDHSKVRERLASTAFARFGVPAPRVGYADVFVNGDPYGLYANVEPVDALFIERIAPGEGVGVLYEGDFDRDLFQSDIDTFDLDAGSDEGRAGLERLVAGLDRALPLTFDLDVGGVVDLEAARVFLAAEQVLGHWDGYGPQRNNYFVWLRPSDGRAVFVPWGTDQIYSRVRDPFAGRGRLFRMCVDWLPCRLPYAETVRRFADMQSAHDTAAEVAAIRAVIDPVLERDPKSPTAPERRAEALTDLLDYAAGHPETMRRGLTCLDPAADLDGDLTLGCAGDCAEDDPSRYPGAREICDDEVDQSCTGITDDGPSCPPCRLVDDVPGARFLLCHGSASYGQPQAVCERFGTRQASVRSAEEQAALTAVAMARARSDWWLGMQVREGEAMWRDGTPVDFTAWDEGEPDGSGGCVVLGRDSGLWREVHCGLRFPVLCRLETR